MSDLSPVSPLASSGTYVPKHPARLSKSLRPPPTPEEKRVRDAAEQLVGQTFFMPLLKQMRDSPFKSEIFSGGRGGEAFGSLLDAQLANRAAHGSASNLVDSIVKKFSKSNPGVAPLPGDATPEPAATVRSLSASGYPSGGLGNLTPKGR